MASIKNSRKSSNKILLYGLEWPALHHPVSIEMDMISGGGQWTTKRGETAGNGLFFHMKRFQQLVWPEEKKWYEWAELELDCYIKYTYIGEMGCAAAGKSSSAASNHLTDWYCHADCTTVLVSSTDMKALELRVWGMIKAYHRAAKRAFPWLPGHLIEGRQMIILSAKDEFQEGRDFKNGLVAVPCKKGTAWVGLGSYVGIHNKRVSVLADESNLMPRAFLDSTSNLSKCERFKLHALGNPNETTNAHGMICEPSEKLGGWEGGIDQAPGTKTWETRFPNGICIQLPGSDSPNMKVSEDAPPPFPFLMTRKQMEDDGIIWGKDDWHYTMMNEAKMPRGQGSRRIITRQQCERGGALLEPFWRDSRITKIAFLDAAYRGVGGDRCIFGELQFGYEAKSDLDIQPDGSLIVRQQNFPQGRMIIALIDLVIVPIHAEKDAPPAEDQIAVFVKEQCEARGISSQRFWYDAGMKTSLVTAFARLWEIGNSLDFGGAPSADYVSEQIQIPCKDYYSKFVTELWYSFRYCVEAKQFRGLTKEAMWEFAAREWKNTAGNKIEVESKSDMKLKTGRSPDLADAIVVGLHGAKKAGFVISRLVSTAHKKRIDDWTKRLKDKARKIWHSGDLQSAA